VKGPLGRPLLLIDGTSEASGASSALPDWLQRLLKPRGTDADIDQFGCCTAAKSGIAPSSGGNTDVRWVLKHRSRSGSTIEHCPCSELMSTRSARAEESPYLRRGVAAGQSLIRFGGFKWALAYLSFPKNQAKMPKQNRDTATTAKGSAGSQIGTLCISEQPDKCGNLDVAMIETKIQQKAAEAPSLTARLRLTLAAPQVGGLSVRVRFAREQTAVDAIGLGRALDPDVLNPVGTRTLGSCVLPSVFREIVSHYLCGVSLLKNLGRTCRLDRATRKHGNSCRAVVDALGENFRVVPLVLAF